jgi:hypothetical protein
MSLSPGREGRILSSSITCIIANTFLREMQGIGARIFGARQLALIIKGGCKSLRGTQIF